MQDIYLCESRPFSIMNGSCDTDTRRPLEEDCIAFVSRETLQGLNFMHERGRIHRDIKVIASCICINIAQRVPIYF